MADTKSEILAALRTIYPLPHDLIAEVTGIGDAVVDNLYMTWTGLSAKQWLHRRPHDGDAIFNALPFNVCIVILFQHGNSL